VFTASPVLNRYYSSFSVASTISIPGLFTY
jgi:hypothetical protein